MSNRASVFLCVLLSSLAASAAMDASGDPAKREWHFKVLLDGKPIGTHDFIVTTGAGEESVQTTARFRVKAVFVSLYHYDHSDTESWKSGCLQRIDANTNDNGKEFRVQGHAAADSFTVEMPRATALQGCVHTFDYWDKGLLDQKHLLNAQTGEYVDVEVIPHGEQNIRSGGGPSEVAAYHYTLKSPKLTIDLWYSRAGDWLALQTQTEGGHQLRYERDQPSTTD